MGQVYEPACKVGHKKGGAKGKLLHSGRFLLLLVKQYHKKWENRIHIYFIPIFMTNLKYKLNTIDMTDKEYLCCIS
jgi:hypothetical protein